MLFGIVGIIMRVAPLGAFGAMAYTIGSFGVGTLKQLVLADRVRSGSPASPFIVLVLGIVAWWHRFNLWKLIRFIREEIFIAFGTSIVRSGPAAHHGEDGSWPVSTGRWWDWWCLPGYSFNLDGTAIYLSIAAVFIAQATNTHLDRLRSRSRCSRFCW